MDSYDEHVKAYLNLVREGTMGWLVSRFVFRLLCLAGAVAGPQGPHASGGEGHLTRRFARNGAGVVGIDTSPRLIEAARNHASAANGDITFLEADLTGVLPARIVQVTLHVDPMETRPQQAAPAS